MRLQREILVLLKTGGSESAHSVGRQSNTVHVFSKDFANNKPAILPLIPARAAEQAAIQSVCKYLEDINKTENDQHGYLKNSLWLAG